MGLYYLLKNTPAGADPYGPENTLTFAVSGITGAPISGQSRCTVVAKAPLTGAVGDSQAGGFWPAELKFAGFDAIVVRGTSPRPVYLWIKDGEFELRDAAHLWGKTTSTVDRILQEELGDDRIQVAQIGPAGEKLVRFAAIMNMACRAHGRGGLGAVMGSKRLKAIVVRGSKKKLNIADAEGLRQLMKASLPNVTADPDVWGTARLGTAGIVLSQDKGGGLPTRNWQSGALGQDLAEGISGELLFATMLKGAADGTQLKDGRDTCYSCAVRCKPASSNPSGRAGRSSPSRAARNTKPSPPWAPTTGCPTCGPWLTPTSCATSTAWTPSRPAPPSPSPWSASRRA